MKPVNTDENHICDIANQINEVYARLSTPEEDYGYQKADVILISQGELYPLQVSYTHKSKKEIRKLLNRGTYPISTHKYSEIPFSDKEITDLIKIIIQT